MPSWACLGAQMEVLSRAINRGRNGPIFHVQKGGETMRNRGTTTQEPEKQGRLQAELDRLQAIFSGIDENQKDFVQRQIEQLAWYNVSIAELQAQIDEQGTVIKYDRGSGQSGQRVNPDIKTMLDYQKCCNTIVRTLIRAVPEKEAGSKLASLLSDFGSDDT